MHLIETCTTIEFGSINKELDIIIYKVEYLQNYYLQHTIKSTMIVP